jgi:hypothetical protein
MKRRRRQSNSRGTPAIVMTTVTTTMRCVYSTGEWTLMCPQLQRLEDEQLLSFVGGLATHAPLNATDDQ